MKILNCQFCISLVKPVYTFLKYYIGEVYKFEPECTICDQIYTENCELVGMRCGHVFHKECLLQQFNKTANCPQCGKQAELKSDFLSPWIDVHLDGKMEPLGIQNVIEENCPTMNGMTKATGIYQRCIFDLVEMFLAVIIFNQICFLTKPERPTDCDLKCLQFRNSSKILNESLQFERSEDLKHVYRRIVEYHNFELANLWKKVWNMHFFPFFMASLLVIIETNIISIVILRLRNFFSSMITLIFHPRCQFCQMLLNARRPLASMRCGHIVHYDCLRELFERNEYWSCLKCNYQEQLPIANWFEIHLYDQGTLRRQQLFGIFAGFIVGAIYVVLMSEWDARKSSNIDHLQIFFQDRVQQNRTKYIIINELYQLNIQHFKSTARLMHENNARTFKRLFLVLYCVVVRAVDRILRKIISDTYKKHLIWLSVLVIVFGICVEYFAAFYMTATMAQYKYSK